MKSLLMLLGMLMFLAGCDGNTSSGNANSAVRLAIDKGVAVPGGYALIEASSYGQFADNLTLYLKHKEDGRVYEYEDGKIGAEIVVPEGYSLVAVSAYGKFANNRTFFCQKNGTDQVFTCSPK
jgi:hypothetical protein